MEQLGERYKNAKLLEVNENSYLIAQDIRLPVIGKQTFIHERNKFNISKKAYLLKVHPEYINP